MKKKTWLVASWLIFLGFGMLGNLEQVLGAQVEFNTDSQVNVEASKVTLPLDPEDPLKIVDPGGGPINGGTFAN